MPPLHHGEWVDDIHPAGGQVIGRVLFNLPDAIACEDKDVQEKWVSNQADGVGRTAERMMKERLNLD